MDKRVPKRMPAFEFDDQEILQVNQLIMDSYNSGMIGQDLISEGTAMEEEVE